jgi:hypothetical protein
MENESTIEAVYQVCSTTQADIIPQIEKGELVQRMLNLLRSPCAVQIANTIRHLAEFR